VNDERKTKKELIAELERLRCEMGEGQSDIKRERAAERIRAEVASMRGSDDLVKVVALMRLEMVRLGIDAHVAAIGFIDEDKKRWRWIMAMDGFRRHGMRADEELPSDIHVVGEDHVKVYDEWIEVPYLIPVWESGQPQTYRRETRVKNDLQFWESMGFRELAEEFADHMHAEQYNTDLPFEHGVVSFAVEKPQDEYVEIVRELTRAVSLGYLRFLDFQELEQQAEQARRERAVERVRAEAMSMRSSDDLYPLAATLLTEVRGLGIDSAFLSMAFIEDEEIVHYFQALVNWTSNGLKLKEDASLRLSILNDEVVIQRNDAGSISELMKERKVRAYQTNQVVYRKSETRDDLDYMRRRLMQYWTGAEQDIQRVLEIQGPENNFYQVPFGKGVIAFGDSSDSEEHIEIVRMLADSFALGYLRFLDFQKVDEAQKNLIDELEEELQTAHTLQMGLMPTESPQIEKFDITGRCIPANHVGGDFFQYFLKDDKIAVCMADVTGHAMEAAVPVMMFSGVLNTEMGYDHSVEQLFSKLNRTMHQSLDKRTYVCFAMIELDLAQRRFQLANSGCPYPFHYRASTNDVTELQVDAYPLGVRAETTYSAIETSLEAGDYLVFCSDGIIEAQNAQEEMFGFEQTEATVQMACSEGLSSGALIDRLIGKVQEFAGDEPQGDDMTCVVLRVEA